MHRFCGTVERSAFAAVVATSLGAFPAGAQGPPPCSAGVTVRDSAGTALPDATVIVGDVALRTDSLGGVRVGAPNTTPLYARVRRIGFAPSRVMIFPACGVVAPSTIVTVAPVATRLSTVTVSAARRTAYTGPLAAFYERRARGEGVFFTHAEMLQRNAQRLSDVLRTVNGVGEMGMRPNSSFSRTTGRRVPERCYPLLVIDGMAQSTIGEITTDQFDPRGLAGVEVYPDASRTPAEFLSLGNGSRCGTVVIWSRRSDTFLPEPHLARADAIPDTLIFDADNVDQMARLDTARSVTPVYPSSLRRKAIDGEVTLEVVVASDGRPDAGRARVLSATHKAFGEAALDGLALFTFEPARRDEQPVAQRVRLTIAFKAND